jgi:uncharacterized protein
LKFWDASAVVSLLAIEGPSWRIWDLFRQDPEVVLWWATPVECVSALARFEREGQVAQPALRRGWNILESLRESAVRIKPSEEVRSTAEHLLTKHPLRAADSLQLAAALTWRQGYPDGASFVTFDHRLRIAATLEGFWVLPNIDEVHESVVEYGHHTVVSELRDSANSGLMPHRDGFSI